ncbi:MAG: alpha/beta hydrolase [Verrucomicrobiales bacterium]|nr:alpha/beta hydrolase [Verrucomicrobiales bacterium]
MRCTFPAVLDPPPRTATCPAAPSLAWVRIVFLLTFVSLLAGAADPAQVLDVWPGSPPDEGDFRRVERTRMSPELDKKKVEVTESTVLVTDVTKPTLTLVRPTRESSPGAALIVCPGGGYWDLYWQLEGEEVARWAASMGMTGVILKYRVPRRPGEAEGLPARRPLQDAQRAVSLIRCRAAELGVDPTRIGIIGFSAGGHLALSTATRFETRSYPALDAVDTVSCRPDFAIAVYPGNLKPKDKDELSPGFSIPTNAPPTFLVHGGEDIISPPEHSVLTYLAFRKAGVPAELHVYARAAHDFGVRPHANPCGTWTNACAAWLRNEGMVAPQAENAATAR